MTRLASIEKAGYYPTPPIVTEYLASHFVAPHGGRILDPCAGNGVALATLATGLQLEPYGNELHRGRAHILTQKLASVTANRQTWKHRDPHYIRAIQGDFQRLELAQRSIQLLYLNPPYDTDVDEGRTEFVFLRHGTRWLQAGGWLVYIVPQRIIGYRFVADYLASYYEAPLHIYRFPNETYERFKQVVILAQKSSKGHSTYATEQQKLGAAALAGGTLPELHLADHPHLMLPPPTVKANKFYFRSHIINLADARAEADVLGVEATPGWQRHFIPSKAGDLHSFRPLMPLKRGHLASLIAAGFLNNYLLTHPQTKEKVMVRGASHKAIITQTHRQDEQEGYKEITRQREYTRTVITALYEDGSLHRLEDEAMSTFLEQWSGQLAQVVADNFPPVYEMELGEYTHQLDQRGSLFPVQKHVTAAVAKRLQTHPDAYIVGEMGTGKTRTGGVVPVLLGIQRTLIICPPHLYKKWIREMKLVYPEARISHLTNITDVEVWFARDERRQPQVGVMKFTTARSASGWAHQYRYWSPFDKVGEASSNGTQSALSKRTLYRAWSRLMSERGVQCPSCGAQLQTPQEVPMLPDHFKRQQLTCPHCNGALYQYQRGKGKTGSFTEHILRERSRKTHRQPYPSPQGGCWRLADYIKQRHKGRIGLLICDEVHQLKSADSDQGFALGRLATASQKVLGLTGTLYGGRSSSIFHLFYRTAPDMRRAYTDITATGRHRIRLTDWVQDYGLLETIETKRFDGITSKQSGNKKSQRQVKEAPGSMPQMLKWILNRCAFMSLADMGFVLPEYEEIPVAVSPTPTQTAQKRALDQTLGQKMRERLAKGDKSLLGAYLQAALCMPDAPWRDEIVIDPKTKGNHLPSVIAHIEGDEHEGLWPKEAQIVELCQQEISMGRRVLLLCQQTNTRDITPRWMEILYEAGLNPAVLRVEASRREAWIEKQTEAGRNVIIAHPKSVETGLDIMGYPTIVWMGTDYSVYTIMQASRRAWRIGQQKKCKVYFFYYEGTLQERALDLIVRKVAAALRVNGDVIRTNSIADLDDSGNIEDALGKIILQGADTHNITNLQSQFAIANTIFKQSGETVGSFEPSQSHQPMRLPSVSKAITGSKATPVQLSLFGNGKDALPYPLSDLIQSGTTDSHLQALVEKWVSACNDEPQLRHIHYQVKQVAQGEVRSWTLNVIRRRLEALRNSVLKPAPTQPHASAYVDPDLPPSSQKKKRLILGQPPPDLTVWIRGRKKPIIQGGIPRP